jgi:Uma2 family endonuclease
MRHAAGIGMRHGQRYTPFMAGENSMPTSAAHDTRLTYADFLQFPDDGKRHEIIDGEHFVSASPNVWHQVVLLRLAVSISVYVGARPGVGRVMISPLDVVLSDYDVVEPDLMFVAADQAGIVTKPNIQGPPALVVEVISSSSRKHDAQRKRRLFDRAGVREYWIVDPELDLVQVFTRTPEGGFTRSAELAADEGHALTSPLLPEWSLDLRELFREE